MLITSTVEICIRHLGWVKEMVFAARRSYANAVLGVVILSVCYTRALWLIQRTYRRYFYTTWTGNSSSQMWFFVQLCSSWQDFNWLKGSRGLSAAAELLVVTRTEMIPITKILVAACMHGRKWALIYLLTWECEHKHTAMCIETDMNCWYVVWYNYSVISINFFKVYKLLLYTDIFGTKLCT